MTVDKGLFLAGTVIAGMLIVSLTTFLVAGALSDSNGILYTVAVAQAVVTSGLFVCTTAAMAILSNKILSRQPDEVSPDASGRRPLYREHIQGAVVYENTESISGHAMIIHPHGQAPPSILCETASVDRPGWRRSSAMPDTLEVFEGSLESVFEQNKGNGR